MEASGGHWKTVELAKDFGGHLMTVENCGRLYRTLKDCGGQWKTVEDSGRLWRTVEDCGDYINR